jgi:hypothetical protein
VSRHALRPWQRSDAVTTAELASVGVTLWAIGWFQVSGRASMDEQLAPLNLGILGLVVAGVGYTRWFLTGRRAVGERCRFLLGTAARPSPAVPRDAGADCFFGAERFYHRADCFLLANRGWAAASRAAHVEAGRIPCGVCKP